MILTREGIQRMIDGVGNGAAGGGGGDISALLAGYATESWVDENYLSIEFFSKLFKAYNSANPAVEIKPNDTQSTITNIKAMFGFWTEQYLSALGQNSGGGGGGVGDVTWEALESPSDYRQIAHSHLTTALSGYATLSALSDYVTLATAQTISGLKTMTGGLRVSAPSTAYNQGVIVKTASTGYGGFVLVDDYTNGTMPTYSLGIAMNLSGVTSIYPKYYASIIDNGSVYNIAFPLSSGTFALTSDITTALGSYLPLTAGSSKALTGTLYTSNVYPSIAASVSGVTKMDLGYYSTGGYSFFSNRTNYREIRIYDNGDLIYSSYATAPNTNYTIWHSGNDGAGSGLDADLLDGQHASYFATAADYLPLTAGSSKPLTGALYITMGNGNQLYLTSTSSEYVCAVYQPYNGYLWSVGALNNYFYFYNNYANANVASIDIYGRLSSKSATFSTNTETTSASIISVTNTYNAQWSRGLDILFPNQGVNTYNSAILFGKDHSENNQGVIDFGYIGAGSASNSIGLGFYRNDNLLNILASGNVGIGTTSPSHKLHVNGNIAAAAADGTFVQIGGIRLVYVSDDNALKVVQNDGTTAANLYATGGVSALGYGVSGGGGPGDVTWDALESNEDDRPIALSHISDALQSGGYLTGITSSMIITALGYTPANNADLSNYLLLNGNSTMTGSIVSKATTFYLKGYVGTTLKLQLGYYSTGGYSFMSNETNKYELRLYDNGGLYLAKYDTTGALYKVWNESNDGTGSGLDADLLDGQHGSYYAAASDLLNYLPLSGGTISSTSANPVTISSSNSGDACYTIYKSTLSGTLANKAAVGYSNNYAFISNEKTTHASLAIADDGTPKYMPNGVDSTGYKLWNEYNDGTGSGLDADLLDGQHGSYYATAASLDNYLPLTAGSGKPLTDALYISASNGELIDLTSAATYACIVYRPTGGYLWSVGANASQYYFYNSRNNSTVASIDSLGALTVTNETISSNAGSNSISLLNITNSYQGEYARGIDILFPNQPTTGFNSPFLFGVSHLTNNQGVIDFIYRGRTSTNNAIGFGFYANDNLMVLNAAGNVGIGTTIPSYKLHVVGSIYSSSDITAAGAAHSQSIELNESGGLSGYGGFIDFHYNGTSSDYSIRLVESTANILSVQAKQVGTSSTVRAGLEVGAGQNASYIQIGNGRIVWDSANQALRVTSADGTATNLYATGGVSALGMNTIATDGTVSANLVPSATETYNIGSTSYLWKYVYANRFYSYYNSSKYGYFYQATGGVNIGTSYGFLHLTSDTDIIIETGAGIVIGNDVREYTSYTVEIHGNTYFTGSISAYSVTQRSDMRWKDVVSDFMLNTESIANAPLFKYTFKDGDKRIMVGTSAQYWNVVMPQTVFTDADGMMSLDYGVTALAGVISVAREVSEHERRIARLEAENATLRAEIEDLKAA